MEDLLDASFAGQQITLLNVRGIRGILSAILKCWASVYTARATFYRAKRGFGFHSISTAVVVQEQIMSEKAGVGFTLHPLTGNKSQMVIEGGYGQGEDFVSGRLTPDTFVLEKKTGKVVELKIAHKASMKKARPGGSGLVDAQIPESLRDKPTLSETELNRLWQLGRALEEHYGYPQDFEWAVEKGKVYLVQTRAVTVLAKEKRAQGAVEEAPIVKGLGSSPGMGSGPVRLVLDVKDLGRVKRGDVLVTRMTTPDYVPSMIKTAGIVTDEGGMTSHAAIVSRELGAPCVVGTSTATKVLREGMMVSVDGSKGLVFRGRVTPVASVATSAELIETVRSLKTRTKIYMNLGVPEKIKDYAKIPFDGIGLMRVEFIIASYVGEHPMHLIETGRERVFIDRLAEGIATVARETKPRPVVVRFSDFKTNEYRELEGGEKYEDVESNPMLGWRGASRYIAPEYLQAFRMELRAIRKVRNEFGLTNVWVMLPFVRTTWEVEKCLKLIEEEGLRRGDTFKVWLMAEVPSMVFLAEDFAKLCDGFSVGSNDLTQLILGIDRDSGRLGRMGYFDERNEAVKKAIKILIDGAHRAGTTVSICGQAPSVYPELAKYLVSLGIDSISVNPDTVVKTKELVYQVETKLGRRG
jgi:pyruvate,water dikinase